MGEKPYERWNAFVDLLANEEFDSLTTIQRAAHLAFWYDSEIQNGGHLQYFENAAGRSANEAILALQSIGGAAQAEVLSTALREWTRVSRQPHASASDYSEAALDGEFEDLDEQYAACEPSVIALLQVYLDQYEAEFLEYDS